MSDTIPNWSLEEHSRPYWCQGRKTDANISLGNLVVADKSPYIGRMTCRGFRGRELSAGLHPGGEVQHGEPI